MKPLIFFYAPPFQEEGPPPQKKFPCLVRHPSVKSTSDKMGHILTTVFSRLKEIFAVVACLALYRFITLVV